MNGFASPEFWTLVLVPGGIGGIAWLLGTFKAKDDDRVGTSLRKAFGQHSRTLVLSALAHLVVCILLWEEALTPLGEAIGISVKLNLNVVTALASGYGANSVAFKLLGVIPRKLGDRADKDRKDGD